MDTVVNVGDVIQLDPAHCEWGPLLMFVEEVRSWGVICNMHIPGKAGEVWMMPMRVEHGKYARVGRLEWMPAELAAKAVADGNA